MCWERLIKFLLICFLIMPSFVYAKIKIVAAENVYGELAHQLGGDSVDVVNILNNPAQDPHLFSATPSIAKAITDADIIIYNGIGYDAWIENLLAGKTLKSQRIVVADLVGAVPGMNPHLWYDPAVMPLLAKKLVSLFAERNKPESMVYQQRLNQFLQTYQTLQAYIYKLQCKLQGVPAVATEPVAGYLTQVLGLQMHNELLQWRIMNDVAPSPSELRTFIEELNRNQVRLVIYNKQVNQPLVQRLLEIAKTANTPTWGVTETQPAGLSYVDWMQTQLKELEKALVNESSPKNRY